MPVAPVAAGDIIQVLVEYRLNEQRLFNTFHYRYDGVPVITDGVTALRELLVDLRTNATDGLLPSIVALQSDEVTYERGEIQKIFPTRYSPEYLALTETGGQAIPSYPPQVSLCVTKKIELAVKGKVGRVEIAGLPQDSSSVGIWANSVITAAQVLAVNMLYAPTVTSGGPFTPVLYNRFAPAGSETLTNTFVQATVRVLRRRTVGLGI